MNQYSRFFWEGIDTSQDYWRFGIVAVALADVIYTSVMAALIQKNTMGAADAAFNMASFCQGEQGNEKPTSRYNTVLFSVENVWKI